MKIRNPRTGELDFELLIDTPESIEDFASKLRLQQIKWVSRSVQDRAQVLLQFADKLEQEKESLLNALSLDTGRRRLVEIEFAGTLGLIRGRCYTAPGQLIDQEKRPSVTNPSVQILQQSIPYPLVGVISPWNFPLLLALIDAIPALLAGCAVLLKPSEVTPRFLDPLEKAILALPDLAAVLKIVRGGVEAGQAVVNQADVICFTGSVSTGRKIAVRCAERFIPAFLELGGKDPGIVMADADLEVAADAIMRSAVGATGQACQSLERIYVDASIADTLIKVLIKKCEALEYNDSYERGGTLGPIILDTQAIKIQNQIDEAVQKGAIIRFGGKSEKINGGIWFQPTILTNVSHDMEIMTEETFGPIIPIMTFENIDQAILLANESKYGLSGSVFSRNEEAAIQVAKKIEVGAVSINDGSLTNKVFDAEKNAFKLSGLYGSRMGKEGLTRFLKTKALLLQRDHPESIHSQDET